MATVKFYALCVMVAIVSFLGFIVENVWLSCTKGFMNNRSMCLPFLLGYGLAIVAIYLLFGTPANMTFLGKKLNIRGDWAKIAAYFLVVMCCVSVGEIVLGTVVEKTCQIVWWDYSRLPLNITKYTSIPTSMGFASLITIFMHNFFTPLLNMLMSMDFKTLHFIAVALMLFLVMDFVYSSNYAYKNHETMNKWQIDTTNSRAYQRLHSPNAATTLINK